SPAAERCSRQQAVARRLGALLSLLSARECTALIITERLRTTSAAFQYLGIVRDVKLLVTNSRAFSAAAAARWPRRTLGKRCSPASRRHAMPVSGRRRIDLPCRYRTRTAARDSCASLERFTMA